MFKKTILFLFLISALSSLMFLFFSLQPKKQTEQANIKISQNRGVSTSEIIVITIDLCPSSKKYEKDLFIFLDRLGKKTQKPLPVGIAVSGKWILRHQDELQAIKKLYLNITWINHSYSHPIENDFLNNPAINFTAEVLDNIKLLEKNNLKPSKYFRFPGLIHNQMRLKQLSDLGYITLDANAWLGKGQKIKSGSVILIHGNGNESKKVVNEFIYYLTAHEKEILSGKLRIVDLSKQ